MIAAAAGSRGLCLDLGSYLLFQRVLLGARVVVVMERAPAGNNGLVNKANSRLLGAVRAKGEA